MNFYQFLQGVIERGVWYGLAHLFVVASTLVLAILTYKSNRKNLNNRSFMFLNLTFSIWVLLMYLADFIFLPYNMLNTISRSTWAFGFVLTIVYLNFCLTFPEQNTKKPLYFWPALAISSTMAILAATTGLVQKDFSVNKAYVFIIKTGSLFNFAVFIYAAFSFGGSWILFRKLEKFKGKKRTQIKYVLLGIFIFILYIFTTDLIPNLLRVSVLSRYGGVGVLFFVGFTGYAVIKHRLMDIRALVFRSLTYSLTFSVIIGAYVLLTYFVTARYQNLVSSSNVVNVLVLIALLAMYNPLRTLIENKTDKLFFKGRYNFQSLMGSINDIITRNSRSVAGLTTEVMNTFNKEMKIDKSAFLLLSNRRGSIRTLGFKNKQKANWLEAIRAAKDKEKALVFDELEEKDREKEVLREVKAEVLLPIKTEERCEAILALGAKKSGDMFSSQDLNLLDLAAPQIAIALENARLYEQAITDALTGLYHHKHFYLRLSEELERAKRYNYPMSLIMLDLDLFKKVNDGFGHQTGDEVLVELASLLNKKVRSYDVVGRYGGDEFTILIPVINKNTLYSHEQTVKRVAKRVKEAISSQEFTSKRITLTASLGAIIFDGKAKVNTPSLIKKADELLYQAKRHGRNSICLEFLKEKAA